MPKELTPTFTVISKACDGDETAISKILEFYDPFINQCCMRPFYDDNNNLRLAVDLEMKGFIKEAIIRKILNFDIKKKINQNKNRIVHIVGFMAYDNHGRVVPRANYCC